MAPKAAVKGAKRGRPAKAVPEPKKLKATPEQPPKIDPLVKAICDVVAGADLPLSCRDMLVACAPQAFASYASARVEIERTVVLMCGEVVESARLKLREQFDEADVKVLQLEGGKDALLTQLSEAVRRRDDAMQEATSCAAALVDASNSKAEASPRLAAAQEVQRVGDAALVEANAHLATMERAFESDQPAVQEAAAVQAAAAAQALVQAEAVQAASVELERERAAKQAAEASRKELEDAEASFATARQAELDYEPALEAAKKMREERGTALQSFITSQVSYFEALRDKEKPQLPTEAPVEPSPPEAEGAVEAKAAVEEASALPLVGIGGA